MATLVVISVRTAPSGTAAVGQDNESSASSVPPCPTNKRIASGVLDDDDDGDDDNTDNDDDDDDDDDGDNDDNDDHDDHDDHDDEGRRRPRRCTALGDERLQRSDGRVVHQRHKHDATANGLQRRAKCRGGSA